MKKPIKYLFITAFYLLFSMHDSFAAALKIIPLLKGDSLANESRQVLSGLLLKEGVRAERSGDISRAIRLFLSGYQINEYDDVNAAQLKGAYARMIAAAENKFKAALTDVHYGRYLRGCLILKEAARMLRDFDFPLQREVDSVLNSLTTEEKC